MNNHIYRDPKIDTLWDAQNVKNIWHQIWDITVPFLPETKDQFSLKERNKILKALRASNHEVVSELWTRYHHVLRKDDWNLNLHLGLTSSDITDNARVWLFLKSVGHIDDKLADLWSYLNGKWLECIKGQKQPIPCLAYTHLLPAKVIFNSDYYFTWGDLIRPDYKGVFHIRGFRGSVGILDGDNNENKKNLPFLMKSMSDSLLKVVQASTFYNVRLEPEILGQNMQGKSAQEILNWMSKLNLSLSKIAQDCRLLVAFGQLQKDTKDKSASSTLVHKHANPVEFERIIGICRMNKNSIRAIEDSLYEQMLSRTLDDSCVWREELPAILSRLAYVVGYLTDNLTKYTFVRYNGDADLGEDKIAKAALNNPKTSRARLDFEARGIL